MHDSGAKQPATIKQTKITVLKRDGIELTPPQDMTAREWIASKVKEMLEIETETALVKPVKIKTVKPINKVDGGSNA